MSGGHWEYLSHRFDEMADEIETGRSKQSGVLRLIATIEHELDWGWSSDTCLACARRRAIAGLETFFDGGGYSETAAVAVLRDRLQNICPECAAKPNTWLSENHAQPSGW